MKMQTNTRVSLRVSDPLNMKNQSVPSPLPLLLQQVGEVVALGDEVGVLSLLVVQLHDGAAVAFLRQQQLLQHPSVRLLLFVLQTVQLGGNTSTLVTNDNDPASASTASQTIRHGHGEAVLVGEALHTIQTWSRFLHICSAVLLQHRFHSAWKIGFCCHSTGQRILLGSNFTEFFHEL